MLKKLYEKTLQWYHFNKLDSLDWVTRNRLIVQKEKKLLSKLESQNSELPERKKILVWATTAWERGGLEHMLAFSLKARGCEIVGVRCGGGYPACSMESSLYPRPDCDYCIDRSKRLLDVFDLSQHYGLTSDWIKPDRVKEILALSSEIVLEDLFNYQSHGVNIGNVVIRDMTQYFMKLIDPRDPSYEERIRQSFAGTLIYFEAAREAIKHNRPDVGIVSNGKTIGFAGFYEACLSLNIPVVTWDGSVSGTDTFILKWNNYANEYHLDDAWESLKDKPLTSEEETFLKRYFALTVKGIFGRAKYYLDPITEEQVILDKLGIQKGRPLVVMLCNLTWDTSTLGRDVGFESMYDWITSTIDACIPNTELDLIIRCHPAEGHYRPEAKSQELVSDIIATRYPDLPAHIHVVSGVDEINSHCLSTMADLISVYTTTVGLEMATRGRLVHVCGESHYRNKGFTEDIDTKEAFIDLLEPQSLKKEYLSERQIELSKKYAYLFLARCQVSIPEFRQPTRHTYEISDVKEFLPGGSQRWDGLCQSVMEQKPFYDISPFIPPWNEEEDE